MDILYSTLPGLDPGKSTDKKVVPGDHFRFLLLANSTYLARYCTDIHYYYYYIYYIGSYRVYITSRYQMYSLSATYSPSGYTVIT